jgi:hypothetical protein
VDAEPQKLEAEVYGALLALGLIEPKDVVRWADDLVAEEGEPDPTVLAISVEGRGDRFDRLDALDALSRVSGECSAIEVTNALLGLFGRWLDDDRAPAVATRVATIVYEMATGLGEAKTPAGLRLRIDEDEREACLGVDRQLSQEDASQWASTLSSILRPHVRHADRLRHAPHPRLP